jgi:hypothetical protein
MTPAAALGRLLELLGVPRDQIPDGSEDRHLLYRSRMRDGRAAVVLDDPLDEPQLRPLIPDHTGGLIVVAGRRTLGGVEAAARIALTELTPAGAHAVLRQMLADPARIEAEPQAADTLAAFCGHLPLALRTAATRLANRPGMTIGDLVERLRPPDERLSWLAVGDLRVRDALAGHYRRLNGEQRHAFRRLCLVPGPETTSAAVAPLIGGAAEERLEELVDAGMLTAGPGAGRYHLNPLLRLYAREALAADESAASVEQLLAVSA